MADFVAGAALRSPPRCARTPPACSAPDWATASGHRCCLSRLQARVTVLTPVDPPSSPRSRYF